MSEYTRNAIIAMCYFVAVCALAGMGIVALFTVISWF